MDNTKKLKWDLANEGEKNLESKWIGPSIYQVILWDPEAEAEAEAGGQAVPGTPGTFASP